LTFSEFTQMWIGRRRSVAPRFAWRRFPLTMPDVLSRDAGDLVFLHLALGDWLGLERRSEPRQHGINEAVLGAGEQSVRDEVRDRVARLFCTPLVDVVFNGGHTTHVKGVLGPLASDHYGDAVTQGVPYSKLVVDVRILACDICQCHVGLSDLGDHALVNQAGELDLVGPDTANPEAAVFEAFDRGLDDPGVHPVEVDFVPARYILLGTKRHDDEAGANVIVAFHGVPLSTLLRS